MTTTSPSKESIAMEVVRDKLKLYIDKYAHIGNECVKYSLYNHRTKTAVKKEVSQAECLRIYEEIYA